MTTRNSSFIYGRKSVFFSQRMFTVLKEDGTDVNYVVGNYARLTFAGVFVVSRKAMWAKHR